LILRNKTVSFCVYWMPLLSYLVLIFYFSHLEEPTGGIKLPISDKVIHFLEFFPLPFLFFRAFRNSSVETLGKNYFYFGMIASVFYACSDEIHQLFIPLRVASFADFLADCLGIVIGGYLFWRIRK